jgi:hypothetical protein
MKGACLLTAAHLVLFAGLCSAQHGAMTIKDYRATHSGTSLDSSYRSALHVDSTKAVFGDRKQEFWDAWQDFLGRLGAHLKSNGLRWAQDTQLTTRIYFNADGTVNTFLYSFPRGHTDLEQQKRFGELLNAFLRENRIGATATEGFAQCGPVMFKTSVPEPPQ